MNLTVSFDKNGCLKVPDVTSGLKTPALNHVLLSDYDWLFRDAR